MLTAINKDIWANILPYLNQFDLNRLMRVCWALECNQTLRNGLAKLLQWTKERPTDIKYVNPKIVHYSMDKVQLNDVFSQFISKITFIKDEPFAIPSIFDLIYTNMTDPDPINKSKMNVGDAMTCDFIFNQNQLYYIYRPRTDKYMCMKFTSNGFSKLTADDLIHNFNYYPNALFILTKNIYNIVVPNLPIYIRIKIAQNFRTIQHRRCIVDDYEVDHNVFQLVEVDNHEIAWA